MPIGLQFNLKCTRPPRSTVEVCEPLRSVTTLDGVYFSNRSGQFLSVRELLYVKSPTSYVGFLSLVCGRTSLCLKSY